jgi:hypothetical protein
MIPMLSQPSLQMNYNVEKKEDVISFINSTTWWWLFTWYGHV